MYSVEILSSRRQKLSLLTVVNALLTIIFTFPGWAQAQEPAPLDEPTGQVILTVTGDVAVTNAEGKAEFDRDLLKEVGWRAIDTTTIWTEGPQHFEGVPLKALADRLGVEGQDLMMAAINDYIVHIPYSVVAADAALLALDRNGTPMTIRDKGPIWVVFPYDAEPEYMTETYHSRSIWQLVSIQVESD
jgi:hypothetical protein